MVVSENLLFSAISSTEAPDDRSQSNFYKLSQTQESGSVKYNHNGTEQFLAFKKNGLTNWVVAVARDYDQVMGSAIRSALLIMVVGIVMIVIVCGVSIDRKSVV